jgi:zona occludens toxin
VIRIITGLPGSGKSLSAVEVLLHAKASARPVYACGIDGLRDDLALPLTDPLQWESLPDGSLIVVDEAQKWFPAKRSGEPIPPIAALSEHRHRGFDFVLITQHPNLLDVYIRRLVGEHIHVLRRFGSHTCERIRWGECVDDPQSIAMRRCGTSQIWRYPKALFTAYTSATQHTHKRSIPWRLVALPLILMGVIGAIYSVQLGAGSDDAAPTRAKAAGDVRRERAAPPVNVAEQRAPLTLEEYVQRHTPRVAGLPYSAPIFDARKPISEPRYVCAATPYRCVCLTEQGTRVQMERNTCIHIAYNGYYDPYRRPPVERPRRLPAPSSTDEDDSQAEDETDDDAPAAEAEPRYGLHSAVGNRAMFDSHPAEPAS